MAPPRKLRPAPSACSPNAIRAARFGKAHERPTRLKIKHTRALNAQLPEDLLMLTDKMSMAVSLECRVPLLDQRLVQLSAGMPASLRMRGGELKYIMKKAMTGLLEPTFKEVRIGVAEVRNTFKVPKFGTIAGCMVTEGRITRAGETQARLLRDNVVVYTGKIGSLRRFKDDVSEVKAGFECGIGFERFNDLKVGDLIEVFAMERVAITA